jgi:hypothetical protein
LRSLVFGLTSFAWLRSVKLVMEISFFIYVFFIYVTFFQERD